MFNLFKDPFADKVKCDECKMYLDKRDVSKVNFMGISYWYCPTHRKPYDEMRLASIYGNEILYYALIEVNEDGTPKGYKKIK